MYISKQYEMLALFRYKFNNLGTFNLQVPFAKNSERLKSSDSIATALFQENVERTLFPRIGSLFGKTSPSSDSSV